MTYGQLPKQMGIYEVKCKEMMFYQYLPIKLIGDAALVVEDRLKCFSELLGVIACDFIGDFGLNRYVESYVYLTAKFMYQAPDCSFNRAGWHSDGFMTEDINYIWCDKYPTIFNSGHFYLLMNDVDSLQQMEEQVIAVNNISFGENQLLRLNQFNIHKVAPIDKGSMRTFLKVSFSKDKYDLVGNCHNYLLNYEWEMKDRKSERNIPQSVVSN